MVKFWYTCILNNYYSVFGCESHASLARVTYVSLVWNKYSLLDPFTKGYQQVRRLMRWNQVGDIKQQMFNQLWKFKQDTFIINHFVIENNLYGMVTRRRAVELRDVPQRHCFVFNITLFILIHFWLGTQKSNTNLNFFMNIKFDKLMSEIGIVFQKRRV